MGRQKKSRKNKRKKPSAFQPQKMPRQFADDGQQWPTEDTKSAGKGRPPTPTTLASHQGARTSLAGRHK